MSKHIFSKIAKIGEEIREVELSQELIKVEFAELSDLGKYSNEIAAAIESASRKATELTAKAKELNAAVKALNSARSIAIKTYTDLLMGSKKLGIPAAMINNSKEVAAYNKMNDKAAIVAKDLAPLAAIAKK